MKVREGGKIRTISRQKAILHKLISETLQGNDKAMSSILSMMKLAKTSKAADQREEDVSEADQAILELRRPRAKYFAPIVA